MPSEERRVSGYVGCRPKFGRMAISLFVHYWCSVVVEQSGRMAIFFLLFNLVLPNDHLHFLFVQCLMFNECPPIKSDRMALSLIVQCWCRVGPCFCCFFVVLLGRYPCCIIMFTCIYYLLTYLASWISSKIAKRGKSVTRAACYFISRFGMNWVILH